MSVSTRRAFSGRPGGIHRLANIGSTLIAGRLQVATASIIWAEASLALHTKTS